ncbi:uracil-DNA glycosylase [Buchnera aphidicola (Thelaxes californica)]|uniref:Uracil-DNA glycosylase n=1 Tax=Buchnera aphidicola (Thelaxes californica) TaxID=1315998 RepID=A0A4D6YMJ2_9GAMM|nr:uracil-DNA glycosylase [Buchnera aphidicola]QCI26988.1 uracil-DNA glycosylase [Buchnera aphidicola (Thelaxes californica)]
MQKIFTWKDILKYEIKKKYFIDILQYIKNERHNKTIFPSEKNVFQAFNITNFSSIKVVIVGQDPYFRIGQAHGLAFSTLSRQFLPPSLKNIFLEIKRDLPDFKYPNHGNLINWAYQGVFLINRVLTVEEGKPHSHAKIGWNIFTNQVISVINFFLKGVIFLLWGRYAKLLKPLIDQDKHFVLQTSHPSPLSVHKGFSGCCHFSQVNKLLLLQKKTPIIW